MQPLLPHPRSGLRGPTPAFALIAALTIATPGPSAAQTWNEVGDAGELIASAQSTAGTGPLTTINGTLFHDADVDLYCISITDVGAFAAYVGCLAIDQNDLMLFRAGGLGVARDRGCMGGQTRVGAPLVSATGFHYLAIAGHGALALNGASPIWNPANTNPGQWAPDGPAAGLPLTGWQYGGPVNPIGYSITLIGASFCDSPTPVDPETWGRLKALYR